MTYIRGLQLAARGPNLAREGHKIGPRSRAKMVKNYCIFFKIRSSVLQIYIFIFVISETSILVKFSSVMQDEVQLL